MFSESMFPLLIEIQSLETCLKSLYSRNMFQGSTYTPEIGNTDREFVIQVQQYSAIGDTAASVNPIAALVWSSVKIVVQVMAPLASRIVTTNTQSSGGLELRELF